MATIADRLDGVPTVLLKEPSVGGDRDVCTSLLTETTGPSVLFISYTRGPDECLAQLDEPVRNAAVVTVGDAGPTDASEDIVTENVSTPDDLTGLDIELGRFLAEWDPPVFVCVDSVTSMLQYDDFETVYEFLHTVVGRIRAADARAHFHIDPDAHDRQDVAAITSLFDASVSVEEGTVRTRDVIE